jgi:hypothetical protein
MKSWCQLPCFAHARRASGQCAQPSPGKFSRTLHAVSSRTWSARKLRGGGLCVDAPHDRYALVDACRPQVRTEVRTSSSHPFTRSLCELGQRLPRKVTSAVGCRLLVSTEIRRTLQWFPLATTSSEGQTRELSIRGVLPFLGHNESRGKLDSWRAYERQCICVISRRRPN